MTQIILLKAKGWRKIYHTNTNQKKAGAPIFISDKAGFKTRKIIKDKEVHYIMIKELVLPNNVIVLKVLVPNNRVLWCIMQKLIEMQEKIVEWTISIGNFNTLPSVTDKSIRQIDKSIRQIDKSVMI